MNRLSPSLGTLSAIGGFIDIGDLVADGQVGARFGLRLAWVTLFTVVGIMCFSEMAGRVALKTQRPALALARSRLGPRFGLFGPIGSLFVTALLVMAELAGVALALQLATSVHYLLWVPVALALVLLVAWKLPFEVMERLYGLLGLAMLVFVVAVWHLDPDWSQLWSSATTPAPTGRETWATYLFFRRIPARRDTRGCDPGGRLPGLLRGGRARGALIADGSPGCGRARQDRARRGDRRDLRGHVRRHARDPVRQQLRHSTVLRLVVREGPAAGARRASRRSCSPCFSSRPRSR